MRITVDLTREQAKRLRKVSESLGIEPGQLAHAAFADLLARLPDDFQKAAKYVLEKNRRLYERLN